MRREREKGDTDGSASFYTLINIATEQWAKAHALDKLDCIAFSYPGV